jgi:Ca-activated chloride channel family protein
MRRRSFFKWITLTTISIVAVLTLMRLAHSDTAAAAGDETKPQSQGSLQVLDKEGSPSGECPLKHTTVKAEVSGFISRVTVTQDFENTFPEKIEAVYQFPLPQAAAVDDLTMLIGDRTIKGKIMRRQEAQAAYTAAKEQGKIASLLNQERPNVFTQYVANIMPGQQIRIVISYVETLKYEDGSYEWSFPMVVGPRYVPDTSSEPAGQQFHHSPAHARNGIRSGHDISLELDLDAGVPIFEVRSQTHETEVQQLSERRSVVRLKDRATIPNKDFVLTYRVAGDSINDAVLTHRSERGGFFTLILQPPQRVSPEDVMPKELVFVLDTSGSMSGFPIEKAKQTMDLALKNLYPHDTFNLITFSGDTEILFPEPVPATPENLEKAKKFLESQNGNGGTEMMKAIRAALDPSDSQYHVRIVCFMTDGLVGNDTEILSEVKKHANARVFAMGFGRYPNRFLLDKMAEYGRGEVDYVSDAGDGSEAARRFHERVRNPLLTDISLDWGGMPVSDVYPANIPDLFSAKPVVLSGRYTSSAEGTIRLKGKMAGQEFVREIPVKLPATEPEHDVLATLWARRKIDDLMDLTLPEQTDKVTPEQRQEEITQLGLTFKLMTPYTSFVAIDDQIFTGGDEPKRVDVPGGISECVTVQTGPNSETCILYSSLSEIRTLQELPLQARSFTGLMTLSPGTSGNQPLSGLGLATNGLRATANEFKVDGVSANFGIAAGGESPGSSASGNAPALTASGGTNGIASLDTIQELNIQTVPTEAEHRAGAQVNLVTRGGTNDFHGSLFHFLGNDLFDANDWFANARGLEQPPRRLNLFGASFSGPINRDHTFFFAAYEGMRLQQPLVGITDVPSLSARAAAPAGSLLNAFPLPTGPARSDGFAEFAASFANPARHDVGSLRIDHVLTSATTLRGRYSFADSDSSERGANGFSLNTTNRIHNRAQAITGTWFQTWSPTVVSELNANYSRSRVRSSYTLDDFGGASISDQLPPSSFVFDLNSRHAAFMRGDEVASLQRQVNLVGSVTGIAGTHEWKFGADYRRLSPIIGERPAEENVLLAGVLSRISFVNHVTPQRAAFNALSLYAQDKWKSTARLTLTYGMRWELAPPPSSDGHALAVEKVDDPSQLKLAAPGTPLWKTTFGNLAPRVGLAYQLTKNADFVLRGAVGVAYEPGQERAGNVFANSIPFISGASSLPFIAFDPHLRMPYAVDWTVSLQRDLGPEQQLSVAYVGSSGRRLIHTETLFDRHPDFGFLRLVTNRGSSDYRALQLKFERSFPGGFSARVLYSWAQSLDNVSDDSERRVIMTSVDPELDRGPSDFDVRHQFAGYLSYLLPAPTAHGLGNILFRNWAVDSIFNARSARPFSAFYMFPTSYGVAYLRPDGFARNSLRGFGFSQVDMGLRRRFNFSESVALQCQADAFNLFNHPNFEDPRGTDLVTGRSLAFGQPTSTSGARTLRFSMKFLF